MHHGLDRRAGEGRLSGEHFVEHAAEAVQVAAPVEVLAPHGLLRTHVRRCADRDAGLRQPLPGGRRDRPGNPEIGHHSVPRLEQDVLRLDVAVHHVVTVGKGERVGDFARDLQCLVERQLLLPVEPVAQRFALDEGHDEVDEAVGLARIVQRQDVGMMQPGGDVDLEQKPLRPHRRRQLGTQHLHRHVAMVLQVLGEVDRGHAAGAALALEAIAAPQRPRHALEGLVSVFGHGLQPSRTSLPPPVTTITRFITASIKS